MNILSAIRHAAGATLLLAGLAGPALAADDLRIDDAGGDGRAADGAGPAAGRQATPWSRRTMTRVPCGTRP